MADSHMHGPTSHALHNCCESASLGALWKVVYKTEGCKEQVRGQTYLVLISAAHVCIAYMYTALMVYHVYTALMVYHVYVSFHLKKRRTKLKAERY
jgi:hypothetical protein